MIKKIGVTILSLCLLAGVLYGGAFLIYQSRAKTSHMKIMSKP